MDWDTGQTKHDQCHRAFLRAASLGIAPTEAIAMVVTRVKTVGGTINPRDIDRQQQRAYAYVTGEPGAGGGGTFSATPGHPGRAKRPRRTSPPPARPAFTPEVLERVAGKAGDLGMSPRAFLGSRSPVDPVGLKSSEVLPHLYSPGEKVLVFTNHQSQGQVLYQIVAPGESGADLPGDGPDGVWMLSNPVDGLFHPNPREGGKSSRRSAEAVTSWRYLLTESDRVTPDQWIRMIIQVPLPIAAIYSSGGDSVHSLVRVDAPTKAEWDARRDAVKSVLITLGACPGSLSAVRLTRLPQALRQSKGQRQELLFLDPRPEPRPILERPALRTPNHYSKNNGLLVPAAYAH